MNKLFWLYGLTFNSAPIVLPYKVDDKDAIILASKDEMKIWKTGYSPYTIGNVPIITSMCMNEGVLFCTIAQPAFKLWYATDLNAENVGNISSNSGFISLEDELGYARKIFTLDESVYVFRDYGITKINYTKGNISINQVYASNTKIYADTIAVCGNLILFLTKDGVYSFNGVKVNLINVNISCLLFDCNNAVAASLGNKYYIALNVDYGDNNKILCENVEHVNNTLIVMDITTNLYEMIRGVDIKSLLPIKTETFEKMFLTFNSVHTDKIGEITNNSVVLESSLPKFWCSKELIKGVTNKLITKLLVIADKDVKFSLKYDNKVLDFTTYKKGLNEFAFKIACKQIMLEVSSLENSAEVEKVYLDYYEN